MLLLTHRNGDARSEAAHATMAERRQQQCRHRWHPGAPQGWSCATPCGACGLRRCRRGQQQMHTSVIST